MIRALTLFVTAAMLGACVPYDEPLPTSPEGWQRRQDGIEQRHRAERERLCRITDKDDPRREELCRGVEGAAQ